MELELTHAYPIGVSQTIEAFFDRNHILARNEQVGARNVSLRTRTLEDESGKLVVERDMVATAEVPPALSGFHRTWNRVRQEEHWFRKDDAEWHCEFRVDIENIPAKIKGSMRLTGTETDTTNEIVLDVGCDIPMLGDAVTAFLIKDAAAKIEAEYRAAEKLLGFTN